LVQFRSKIVDRSGEVSASHVIEKPLHVDAVDQDGRRTSVATPIAIARNDQAVIDDRGFGTDPTDDSSSFMSADDTPNRFNAAYRFQHGNRLLARRESLW
jgi:hypothetical protein